MNQKILRFILGALMIMAVGAGHAQQQTQNLDALLDQVDKILAYDHTQKIRESWLPSLRKTNLYQQFLRAYKRYALVKSDDVMAPQTMGYKQEIASQDMDNLFARWALIARTAQRVEKASKRELQATLKNIDFMLDNPSQSLTETDMAPTLDGKFVRNYRTLKYDIEQELATRQQGLDRGAPASDITADYLTLPSQLDSVTMFAWDPSSTYLAVAGLAGQLQMIVVYQHDEAENTFKQCGQVAIRISGATDVEVTQLVWGAEPGLLLIGGHARDHRFSFLRKYYVDPQIGSFGYAASMHHSFDKEAVAHCLSYNPDRTSLAAALDGQVFMYRWTDLAKTYLLDKTIYPDFSHVHFASMSHDGAYVLTCHYQMPYLRLSNVNGRVGEHFGIRFKDKLTNAVWHPATRYFAALSKTEVGVIILYYFDEAQRRVIEKQRIFAGAVVENLTWSADGKTLVVSGDAGMKMPYGVKIYDFNGSFLHQKVSLESVNLPVNAITVQALAPNGKKLAFASSQSANLAGALRFESNGKQQSKSLAIISSVSKREEHCRSIAPQDLDRVYENFDEVPSFSEVGSGSLIVLQSVFGDHPVLAAITNPNTIALNNGMPIPVARPINRDDVVGDSLAMVWLVEPAQWLNKLDLPLGPMQSFALRNLACNNYLGLTPEHSPLCETAQEKMYVTMHHQPTYFVPNYIHTADAETLCVRDTIGLQTPGSILALDGATRQSVLSQSGMQRLVMHDKTAQARTGSRAWWKIAKTVPFWFVCSQAARGSMLFQRIFTMLFPDLVGSSVVVPPAKSLAMSAKKIKAAALAPNKSCVLTVPSSGRVLAAVPNKLSKILDTDVLVVAAPREVSADRWIFVHDLTEQSSPSSYFGLLQHEQTSCWLSVKTTELTSAVRSSIWGEHASDYYELMLTPHRDQASAIEFKDDGSGTGYVMIIIDQKTGQRVTMCNSDNMIVPVAHEIKTTAHYLGACHHGGVNTVKVTAEY